MDRDVDRLRLRLALRFGGAASTSLPVLLLRVRRPLGLLDAVPAWEEVPSGVHGRLSRECRREAVCLSTMTCRG